MRSPKYDVVIVGAGIAGIAAGHALINAGAGRVALIERDAPLSLTSDKSTECYRNFWPGPDSAMAALMNRSIDMLQQLCDQSANRFQLHQRGYLFATARSQEIEELQQQALDNERYGGGPLRYHGPTAHRTTYRASPTQGYDATLDGADLITDKKLIEHHFPYLTGDTIGVLHARRCGVLSAQQLGMYLLEEARGNGLDLITADFSALHQSGGRVSSVEIRTADGVVELETDAVVLSSGPHLKSTAALAGTLLPVVVEKHVKISLADKLGVLPREAPLIVWNDPTNLTWSAEDLEVLTDSAETRFLTETFPAGVHGRPVGAGDQVFLYWTYDCEVTDAPVFPIESDPYYPEILLRGMARMVPGLAAYLDPMPRPYIDGGYYTKVADNRPLIGALDVPGTYVCSAFSGYGIMASCAGGELLADHLLGRDLPSYADAFNPGRLIDTAYLKKMAGLSVSGQI